MQSGPGNTPSNPASIGDETLVAAQPVDDGTSQTLQGMIDSPPNVASGVGGGAASPIALPGEAYAVGPEIARGGMGCVLQAEDRKLGRIVAMKVMRLEAAASEGARARFVREATVLARLEHPNIVPIHELGWDVENRLYYTMKLVQGRTLQAILNGLRHRDPDFVSHFTLDRLLTIFRKICDAMSLAHSRGVIHRDLKPDNAMVGEFGEVLVMDWGLAKIQADAQQAAEEAARKAEATQPGSASRFRDLADSELRRPAGLTLDGDVMGTPFYMSPEQASGRGAELDQQSDIFSLGGILYAILTLHPPVDGKTAPEIMDRIMRGEIFPPTAFSLTHSGGMNRAAGASAAKPKEFQPLPHCPGGKAPAALSAVTMRALALNKSDRYKTVAELAADIEAYQGGFATRAEEAGLFTQLRLLIQRHKREFTVALGAWLIITGLAAWFVINLRASERETRRQAQIARENERLATDNAVLARKNEGRAVDQAARATKAERQALDEEQSARRALARSQIAVADAAYLGADLPSMVQALESCPDDLRDRTWHYLWEKRDSSAGSLTVRGFETLRSIAAVPHHPGQFALGNFGGKIAVADIIHAGAINQIDTGDRSPVGQLLYSDDGTRLAAWTEHNRVFIYEQQLLRELRIPPGDIRTMALGHDGKQMAIVLSVNSVEGKLPQLWLVLADADDGHVRWTAKTFFVDQMTFNGDATRLLMHGSQTRMFWILSALDGHEIAKASVFATSMALGADGTTVALGTRDGEIVFVDPANAVERSRVKLFTGMIRWLDWMSDGRLLLIGSQGKFGDERWVLRYWNPATLLAGNPLFGVNVMQNNRVALDPASGILLVHQNPARYWRVPVGRELVRQSQRSDEPGQGCFLSETRLIGRKGGNLTLYDLKAPANPIELPTALMGGNIMSAVHRPTGLFVVAKRIHDFSVFSQKDDQIVEKFSGAVPSMIFGVRFDQTGDRLALISNDRQGGNSPNSLRVYSIQSAGKVLLELPEKLQDAAFVVDGNIAVLLPVTLTGERVEYRIELRDGASGQAIRQATYRFRVNAMAVSPDYRTIAIGGTDRMVHLIDARTLVEQSAFRVHDGDVDAIAFHPTAAIIATASSDGSVKLWDYANAALLDYFLGLDGTPTDLAFSPSGRFLYVDGQEHMTRIFDMAGAMKAIADNGASRQTSEN